MHLSIPFPIKSILYNSDDDDFVFITYFITRIVLYWPQHYHHRRHHHQFPQTNDNATHINAAACCQWNLTRETFSIDPTPCIFFGMKVGFRLFSFHHFLASCLLHQYCGFVFNLTHLLSQLSFSLILLP